MNFETRLDEILFRIKIIKEIAYIADDYTYDELGEMLHLSPPIISRYIRGHVLPNIERSVEIYEIIKELPGYRPIEVITTTPLYTSSVSELEEQLEKLDEMQMHLENTLKEFKAFKNKIKKAIDY